MKILYIGLDPTTRLIKDLNRDNLAHDLALMNRAHWIASSIIRRLRRPVDNVRSLLTILEPRATTKPPSHMTVLVSLLFLPTYLD